MWPTIMFVLWAVLMFLLCRETYRLLKKKKMGAAIGVSIFTAIILFFTGGWAIFYVFLVGCALGFDAPCYL